MGIGCVGTSWTLTCVEVSTPVAASSVSTSAEPTPATVPTSMPSATVTGGSVAPDTDVAVARTRTYGPSTCCQTTSHPPGTAATTGWPTDPGAARPARRR